MRITHKKAFVLRLQFNKTFLSELSISKYLGLWIWNKINCSIHIIHVTANAKCIFFFLRRTLKFSLPSVRLLAYQTIVLPILDYSVMIRGNVTRSGIAKVEQAQRTAACFIVNRFTITSVTELLRGIIFLLWHKEIIVRD